MKLKFWWQKHNRPSGAIQKDLSAREFWDLLNTITTSGGLSYVSGITGWVYACMSRIAHDISMAILEVYDGDRPIEHDIIRFLQTPNPYNLREFLFQTAWLLLSEGRAVWWIRRSNNDEYMIPLPGAQPVVSIGEMARITGYRVGGLTIGLNELLVVARYDPHDPTRTISPLQALEDVDKADKLTWQWTRSILEKWWHIQYGIRIPHDLPSSAADKLVNEIRILHEGPEKAGRPAVLPPGTDILPLATQNAGEMAGKMPYDPIRDRILGVFGVPASVLGLVKDVNRANAEANRRIYRENTLAPILGLIAEALTTLTPRFGKQAQVYLTLPISPDPDDIRATVIELVQADIITINEARRELGYDDVEWGNMPLGVLRIMAQQGLYTPKLGTKTMQSTPILKAAFRREAIKAKRRIEREAHAAYCGVIAELWSRIVNIPRARFIVAVNDALYDMRANRPGIRSIILAHYRAYMAGLGFGFGQIGKRLPSWELELRQDDRAMQISLQRAERSYALTLDAIERELIDEFPGEMTDEEFADWLIQRYSLLNDMTALYAARLTTTAEFSAGQMASYAEEGIMAKIWLTTGDDKVRDTHREMEGIEVPLGEDFILPTGARGPAPGQLDDDAENWNCRCILAPKVG